MEVTPAAGQRGPVSSPNIVPLIDVLLVLIIIFMVITPQLSTGLPAFVPEPQSKREPVDPYVIVVRVMPGNRLMINEDHTDWDALGTRLTNIFKQRADKVAFVSGAEEVSFAEVARAIDIMKTSGVAHIGLITAGAMTEEGTVR